MISCRLCMSYIQWVCLKSSMNHAVVVEVLQGCWQRAFALEPSSVPANSRALRLSLSRTYVLPPRQTCLTVYQIICAGPMSKLLFPGGAAPEV